MKKPLRVLFATVGAAMLCSTPVSAAEFITVLTGGTSGVYYPLGVALSQIYEKHIPDTKNSVQSTKASVENLNLIQSDRGEVAFTLGDSLSSAWSGNVELGFKQPLKKLRAIAGIYPNYIQVFALESSGIKSLADMKGKRISVGAPKSGTELNARAILAAAGLSYSDFSKVEYLGFNESVELMKNDQLDITLQSAGLGGAALRDLAVSRKVVVVPIPAEIVEKVGDPAYQSGVIPANTYEGQKTNVPTAYIQNFLVTRENLSDETVYKMTKSLWDNLANMVSAHSAAKAINLEGATKAPVPFHNGAIKFYKEVGAMK